MTARLDPRPDAPAPGGVLRLAGSPELARGYARAIYAHPERDGWLVKIYRPDRMAIFNKTRGLVAHLKKRRLAGPYGIIRREFEAQFDATMRAWRLGLPTPFPLIGGVVLTDMGPGQVVEMVRDAQGVLAPTLRDVAKAGGLDGPRFEALNLFARLLFDLRIVTPDITARNVLYEDRRGPRFVLIDGFGDPNVLPFRSWFPALRMRNLHKRLTKIGSDIGLPWNPEARRFERR